MTSMFGWPAIVFSSVFIVVLAVSGVIEHNKGNPNAVWVLPFILSSILVIIINAKEVKAERKRREDEYR
jgi:hypothetical protein